ncbi:hypothetical protein AA313_de0207886 [Arthrobotrys entomopaga]|nr:hypothetical protein AA313_de0207886 [Arthrobotrys entomopaga]
MEVGVWGTAHIKPSKKCIKSARVGLIDEALLEEFLQNQTQSVNQEDSTYIPQRYLARCALTLRLTSRFHIYFLQILQEDIHIRSTVMFFFTYTVLAYILHIFIRATYLRN